MVEFKRILPRADVAGIDAAQAEGFQMPNQITCACAGLGKSLDPLTTKERNQRQHRWVRRRVEVGHAALEL